MVAVSKRILPLLVALSALTGQSAAGQSVLDRSPNLAGGWVGSPSTLYFHFLHRFDASDPPLRKVSNWPTFLLGFALPGHALLGIHYATNSLVAPGIPNEWEYFARYAPLLETRGAPLDLALQAGYNLAAESVDGELTLARELGLLRLIAALRAFSSAFDTGDERLALAGGLRLRLGRLPLALAGDIASMLDSEEPTGQGNEEDIAWSAGIQLAIPYTPHTLSLHAANSITSTLQGASRGSGTIRYGFEFTIPLHLRRYFGGAPAAAEAPPHGAGEEAPAAGKPAEAEAGEEPVPEAGGEPAAAAAVRVSIRDFAFAPARLEVAAGSTVTWTNNDQVAHSATADAGDWDSGLIQPGRSSSRKFEKPGTYAYHCTPHPFIKAVVVVR